MFTLTATTQEVLVWPDKCVCPTDSYTCRADLVTVIVIQNSDLADDFIYVLGISMKSQMNKDGVRVTFSSEEVENGLANLTAQLSIIDIPTWNNSTFSCRTPGRASVNFSVCVTGKTEKISTFVTLNQLQDQPLLPLGCQWCGTHHQLWSVSSLQCMVENVWTIMW